MDLLFYPPRWTMYIRCVEKISLIVNSSANFAFYTLFGKDLRTHMKKCIMFPFCRKRKLKFDGNSSTSSRLSARLSDKKSRNRSHLEKKDILSDIDEKEENEISLEDIKLPSATMNQVTFS